MSTYRLFLLVALSGIHSSFASEVDLKSDEVLEDAYPAQEVWLKERTAYYYNRGMEIGAMYKTSLTDMQISPEIAAIIKQELVYTQVLNEISVQLSRPNTTESDKAQALQLLLHYANGFADSLKESVEAIFRQAIIEKRISVSYECDSIEIEYAKEMYKIHRDQALALSTACERKTVEACMAKFSDKRARCQKKRTDSLHNYYHILGMLEAQSFITVFACLNSKATLTIDDQELKDFDSLRRQSRICANKLAELLKYATPESEFFKEAFPLYRAFCQGLLSTNRAALIMQEQFIIMQKKTLDHDIKLFMNYLYADFVAVYESAQKLFYAKLEEVSVILIELAEKRDAALKNYKLSLIK